MPRPACGRYTAAGLHFARRLCQQVVRDPSHVGVEMAAEHVAQDRPQVLGQLFDQGVDASFARGRGAP